MVKSQNHRGPDGQGYALKAGDGQVLAWKGKNNDTIELPVRTFQIGLGHNWLAIQDVNPLAQQPFMSETHWLVYNGEIYNFYELREELVNKGYRFTTRSDTEVLLYLWEEYGEDCLQYLRGMFAFLLYDIKRDILWAARDRFGIKPLYYAPIFDHQGMVFASEIRAFHASKLVAKEFHPSHALAFLAAAITKPDSRETLYRGVYEVNPGEILKIEKGKVEPKSYYLLAPPQSLFKVEQRQEATEKLQDLFIQTMRMHLRSSREIGTCLSGGLDSTNIAYAIQTLAKDRRFKAFTIGNRDHRDVRLASMTTEQLNVEHTRFPTQKELDLNDLIDLVRVCEIPNHSWGPINQYLLIKQIKEKYPLSVLIDGQGGDEVLSGYPWFIIAVKNWVEKVYDPVTADKLLNDFLKKLPFPRPVYGLTLKMYFSKKGWIDVYDQGAASLLNVSPGELLNLPQVNYFLNDGVDWPEFRSREIYRRELQFVLRQTDRIGMAFSIENRVPYLDHHLVELIGNLDPMLLFHRGYCKFPLRVLFPEIPLRVRFNIKKIGFWENYSRFPEKDGLIGSIILDSPFLAQFIKHRDQVNQLGFLAKWRFFQLGILDHR
jgi:asparagine synthase (glutamine-hydrolysing)